MTEALAIAVTGTRRLDSARETTLSGVVRAYLEQGYKISTGGAQGADQVAVRAVEDPQRLELYLPWASFEAEAISGRASIVVLADDLPGVYTDYARRAHPLWDRLNDAARRLMIRNVGIVLRRPGQDPSALVLATPDVRRPGWGGTGHTMRIAHNFGIPVWLLRPEEPETWVLWKG